MTEARRLQGRVKTIHRAKGFAFITGADLKDYFMYYQAIASDDWETLKAGDRVTFIPDPGIKGKGPRAENVQLIG